MNEIRFFRFALGVVGVLLPAALLAQNTSNVFSPDVRAGSQAVEWRFAYDPDTERYATRLHYQLAVDERWRHRLIVAGAGGGGRSLEPRYLRWEAMWQFAEDEVAGWDSALRFEAQVAEGDNLPSRVRLAWTGKWDLAERWQGRLNFIAGRQVGPRSGEGILLEGRARLAYALSDDLTLAADLYSDFNDTEAIGSFAEQEHQLGPLLQWDLGNGFDLNLGALFGLSSAAADTEWRIHLIRGF